ncbi:MAG TPA: DMT family transporter [Thermoanaerobaculia bacterium]|nr:DMT family transporter [Thermoanaerobaculia bacterium]
MATERKEEAGERAARRAVLVATLLVALSAGCFGANSILTVVAIRARVPLYAVLFWRYGLAAPMLAAVALLSGPGRLALPRGRLLPLLTLGGGGQALVIFLAMRSLDYISAATLGFLFYTYPAWVALFAALRGSERIDRQRALALLLSLAGIVLMVGAPGAAALHPIGVALALGAAVAYALFIPLIGRLQAGLDPAAASTYVVLAASAIFGLLGLATGNFRLALPPVGWAVVTALALISTTLGFIAFLLGLQVLGPVRTAIVSTVEPFWIAVLGLVVLSQPIPPAVLGGGVLIAAAVVLLQKGSAPVTKGVQS